MAARMKETLSVDAVLVPGGNGVFDVVVDGRLVYSKHETGQFPDEDSLVKAIASS